MDLFKELRPTVTLEKVLITASEPSICGASSCCCNNSPCRLKMYMVTIFIDRREQGRCVTKPWIRASSTEGFADAVKSLIIVAEGLVAKARSPDSVDSPADTGNSDTCCVEVLLDAHDSQEAYLTDCGCDSENFVRFS